MSQRQSRVAFGALVLFTAACFWAFNQDAQRRSDAPLVRPICDLSLKADPVGFIPAVDGRRSDVFHSQMKEDRVLFNHYFRGRRNGTFLELGAVDGHMFSNTLFFEQELGWTGVLIEAFPPLFARLQRNRPKNKLFSQAICKEGQKTLEFYGTDSDPTHSSWLVGATRQDMSDGFKEVFWKNRERDVIQVPCGPIDAVLAKAGIKHLDLVSLDVEGAELTVLSTWDWSVTADVLLIEANGLDLAKNNAVAALLRAHGYRLAFCLYINEVWERIAKFPDPTATRFGYKEPIQCHLDKDAERDRVLAVSRSGCQDTP